NLISNVILGGSVAAIGSRAFAGNRLSGVIIPPSLDSLGPEAFGDRPLRYSYAGRLVTGQKALEQELRRRPLTASFLNR
ncbi:MAG: leucine-rich repeat domain-containing protein, partial [Treponema sp.]|nr:leucine-rich repeat domain-containing protein [Treponema sp.]